MSETAYRAPAGGRPAQGLPPARVPVPRPPGRRTRIPLPAGSGSRRGRLVAIGTWTLLALVVGVFAALVAGPRTGHYRVSVVLSDSMRPQWEAGDMVVMTPQPADGLRVGQVITYNPPIDGRPSITHRVVAIDASGSRPVITTKGDANPAPDDWGAVRLTGDTVWVVRGAVPNAGHVLALLQGRALVLLTTVLAPLALLIALLIRIWRPAPATARAAGR